MIATGRMGEGEKKQQEKMWKKTARAPRPHKKEGEAQGRELLRTLIVRGEASRGE